MDIDNKGMMCCLVISILVCFFLYRYLLNRTIMIEKFNDHTIEY